MSELAALWSELADIKDELAGRDWFMGTSGNLSIKVAQSGNFLITASGKDKRKKTNEDFLLVDANGNPAEETYLRPSAETLLHTEIYSRTAAGSVLHIHTVENNVISELFGDAGKVVFKGHEIIKATGRWEEDAELVVPIIYNHADIPTLTDEFSHHIHDDAGAVLIRNHGITVWGKTGLEAKKILEACEFLFQYTLVLNQQKAFTTKV
ncbi:methylthioribulose 1-phosphate dehydratase [Peribacillus cavernae]|uniref:Methylthioribulose-1-phosphate dehydratase n=1 Tax=Peribacillus cavernae TaxID=1674310 RepID=A0A3S0U2C0_9BACI|nr:methylthioribulose 1-phosphate dehydratase [Peribacillus cavernae]MDQ0217933.1 methylthioribulose-1-phosphate dehydratase [Peribacillus cavernae]RUQ32584.1 methylthioribulose 1-phosphate dehydratase [Peribacillus cavernae]